MPRPSAPAETPADRLRAALARLGLTRRAAAERLGVNEASLGSYLTGRRPRSLDWLHHVATTLGIDPSTLDDRLSGT